MCMLHVHVHVDVHVHVHVMCMCMFAPAAAPSTLQAPLPRVHCHCFSKAEDPVADVIAQAEAILGCPLPGATAHIVRDVSPHKLMMCVSFLLPDAVCWADGDEGAAASAASGSDQKRQRSE
jgi:hypothetical protein